MTRGALTTFPIANDVAKYFATIIQPGKALAGTFPVLNVLNIMHLRNAGVGNIVRRDFNALIIVALIPLGHGAGSGSRHAAAALCATTWIHGLGGSSFRSRIKLIDMVITCIGWLRNLRSQILRIQT